MKIKSIAVLGLVATVAFTSCNKQKRQDSLATEIDSVSYALGLDMANKIEINFPNANSAAFIGGYEDAADTTKVKIDIKDIDGILRAFFQKKQQEAMAKANDSTATSDENLNDIGYIQVLETSNNPADENTSIFRQYEYLAGGQGGNLNSFTQFQVKIVMTSSNTSKPPKIKDLRT